MSEERKLPKGLEILDKEPVFVQNPYSGEGCVLKPDAVAVYDWVKGCEALGDVKSMYKGLDWFKKYEPDAYMVLLD